MSSLGSRVKTCPEWEVRDAARICRECRYLFATEGPPIRDRPRDVRRGTPTVYVASQVEHLSTELVGRTSHGRLALRADGSFTYTPDRDYHGRDSFTYRVRDADGARSSVATVRIAVTPVADRPACTIARGSGHDVIRGTPEDDVICAGSGNDSVYGRGGDDVILGGSGNDRLRGGDGNDRLSGGLGSDRLTGGAGDDRLYGSLGSDTLDTRDGRGATTSPAAVWAQTRAGPIPATCAAPAEGQGQGGARV